MKIHNAEKPQIIATLRHYEKGTLLYFDEKNKEFKEFEAPNCWLFRTNKNAKTQIAQLINLGECKMDKDIAKSIVELFANKLDLKEVIVTAESHNESYIFDLYLEFSFKIEKDKQCQQLVPNLTNE